MDNNEASIQCENQNAKPYGYCPIWVKYMCCRDEKIREENTIKVCICVCMFINKDAISY